MKNNFLDVAVEAALKAGKVLLGSYGKLKDSQISLKAKNDFVTSLDKKSEKIILAVVKKYFPDHAIQAEESGLHKGTETLWLIDPLDGTSNYIHQFPLYAVSIGVMKNNKIIAGVIYDPLHKELFTAEMGCGAFLNGRKIRVAPTKALSDALMTTGIPFRSRGRFHEYMDSFSRISLASAGMRRGGSAALDLAYVACGRLDGFWELDLAPWDIAAGAVILKEAGGVITDAWGDQNHLKNGDIVAANPKIHRELVRITSKAFSKVRIY